MSQNTGQTRSKNKTGCKEGVGDAETYSTEKGKRNKNVLASFSHPGGCEVERQSLRGSREQLATNKKKKNGSKIYREGDTKQWTEKVRPGGRSSRRLKKRKQQMRRDKKI